MRSSFRAFGLGVALTAMTLGAVTYVNASTNATIRVCANKKTGAMRYITKGKCKKTETALSWNQQGLQGLQGLSGVAGPKGDAGTNGTTLQVIDATGAFVGYAVGDGAGGRGRLPGLMTLVGERLWMLDLGEYRVDGTGAFSGAYADSNCSTVLGVIGANAALSPQVTYVDGESGTSYISTAVYASGTDMSTPVYWKPEGSQCTEMPSNDRRGDYFEASLVSLTPITAPSYTAPLSIVSR